jgi:hypothetical protein
MRTHGPILRFPTAFLLLILWSTLIAQETSSGKIWFNLHVENPNDSTSAVVSWPAPGDVLAEPGNAPAIAAFFETLVATQNAAADAATADQSSPQLGQSGEDFIINLKTALTGKGFSFTDDLDLPNQTSPAKLKIGIQYTAFVTDAPPSHLPFEVWVKSSLLPANSPAFRWSIRELAANPVVQSMLRAQSGETSVIPTPGDIPEDFSVVVIPPLERDWRTGVSNDKPSAEQYTPIFAVAVAAAREAIHRQIMDQPRTVQNRDRLAQVLRDSFGHWPMTGEILFQDELSMVDGRYEEKDQPAWVLRLTRFDPVRSESVTIDEIQLGSMGRQPWDAFVAHQQVEGKSMDRLLAQKSAMETKLTTLLANQLPWGKPHFATTADHEPRVTALGRQTGVAGVEMKVSRDQVAYSVVWFPVLTSLEASGTYNSDRGGNVSGKLSVQARDFSAGVEGFIANRRRGLFADISTTPKLTHLPDQAKSTWGVLADYTREDPVRLGTPKAFSLEDEESRAGLRWRLEGGHSTAAPVSVGGRAPTAAALTRTRRWKLEAIAGYRRARLDSENFAFAETPDGEAPFASSEFTGEWEHGASRAQPNAAFHLEVGADASSSHRGVSSFVRGQFKATEEIQLGRDRWENSLMRLTASGGAASDGTPVAWWYRLGGDERMRGLEFGELAGRSFLHAGIEAGFGLGAVLGKPSGAISSTAAPGLNFRQIRVLFGVEHAWINRPPIFIPALPILRSSSSYSVTGEYAGAIPGLPGNSKLAIGYGYSPESSHRSGRVFVTLRVPLSIPQPP